MPYKDADATLARLAEGFERFRSTWFEADRAVYDELVWQGQTPRVLVVGCSDSRADPQLITGARPGEIFTIRNVAALVPPYRPESVLAGVSSALEFGVKGLEVAHIVVMGHAMCGGIRSLMGHGDDERIEPRWVTTIGLSFDHRLADGQQGSTFLADVAQILSDPGMALVLS